MMLFKDLREKMILPDKEIIINKNFTIDDKQIAVLGIISQNSENKLYMLIHDETLCRTDNQDEKTFYDNMFEYEMLEYENFNSEDIELEEIALTNRYKMGKNISVDRFDVYIKEMNIQGKKIIFDSSETSMCDPKYDICMILQYFSQKCSCLDCFNDYDTNSLVLLSCHQKMGENLPEIDFSLPLDIKLNIFESFKAILVEKPMTVSFDNISDNCSEQHGKNMEKYSFYSEEDDKEYNFYINGVMHYDIWKDADNHFESEKMKEYIKKENISDEQLVNLKETYYEAVEAVCPRGMDLAIIEYETEDDIQLDFYTKNFLDAEVEENDRCGVFMLKPDNPIGKHGLKNRICILERIDKNFNENMDIELFLWYKKIPKRIISLC